MSAADSASPGEAKFSMSSTVPTIARDAIAVESQGNPQRLSEAVISFPLYFQTQSVMLWIMTSGFFSVCPKGPGTQPGRA